MKWLVERKMLIGTFDSVFLSFDKKIIGKPPFDSQSQQDTIRLIRSNDLSFPSNISVTARDLISRVMTKTNELTIRSMLKT